MLGLIKGLFSPQSIIDGIDKVILTEEERKDIHLAMLPAYEPFKKAQRLLMLIVTIPFMLLNSIAVVLGFFSIGDYAVLKDFNLFVAPLVITIAGFYFYGGARLPKPKE